GRGGVALGPLGDVAALDGGGHEVGEGVRGAGERGHPEAGQRGGVVVVVPGGALVGQGQQDDYLHARGGHVRDPAQHLVPVAALEQVADQDEDREIGRAHV